ncbi:MAG: hypothetical protein HF973_19715 [Chloroflexi bacterium]|nr:hypothetical protein [Chloroflexota bacterium]
MTNERVPRLRKRYDHVPITAAWLPPDDFELALPLTPAPTLDPVSFREETAVYPSPILSPIISLWKPTSYKPSSTSHPYAPALSRARI